MIIPPGPLKVLVSVKPVDFRKGMVGLARWCSTNCN
jgi:transposase